MGDAALETMVKRAVKSDARKKKWAAALACILLVSAMLGFRLCKNRGELTACPAEPKTGVWYTISPEGAYNADASGWSAKIRMGSENCVLVYLLGGGVSLDAYSAARSATTVGADGFYYDRDDGLSDARAESGIASTERINPFRNWTVLMLPYTTADFHAGDGAAEYIALNGETSSIRHNGYANCMAALEATKELLSHAETLLIAGYSAGGFGASMLAEDILSYFPNALNVTVCVDGALLLNDAWRDVARERWHAPEKIVDRITTDNLALDQLIALHEAREDVKILFTCSLRDGGLAKYQSYIDGNAFEAREEYGDIMEANLRETAYALQRAISTAGIYIWDEIPYAQTSSLTKHTILASNRLFDPMEDNVSVSEWIYNAVEGSVENHGLSLLES